MPTLFVLLGPTGVGKTDLAIKIAQHLHSPIINADSRQIYRDIPIGTAAPTSTQQQQVKHYFVGTLPLDQYFSAAQYETQTLCLLEQLFEHANSALLTGGSMLYIDAVCKGIDDIPTVDADTRLSLRQRLHRDGLSALCQELKLLDPDYYHKADLRNTRRIVHALEICYMTGRPYSSFLTNGVKQRPFNIVRIGLNRPRQELFARINQRVIQMLDNGFEQEARRVYPQRHLNSLNTVGFKEMFNYFDGQWSLDQAIEKIQRNTRVYAKKQLTWFSKDSGIKWFHPDDAQDVITYIDQLHS